MESGITSREKVSEANGGHTATSKLPKTEAERSAIHEQLERILANPFFKNSKRYPSLLRYVVEQSLHGHYPELKERTLGVEVFAREPEYDTNLDPVVRTTAAEIRKRLAQYYQDPKHDAEIRINLPLGSYAPTFEEPTVRAVPEPIVLPVLVHPPKPRSVMPLVIAGSITVIAVLGLVLRSWASTSALDLLWNPVLESSAPVLMCVGQRPFVAVSAHEARFSPPSVQDTPPSQITLFQLYYLGSQNVAMPDVVTLGRLSGLLEAKGKQYRISGESSTTFDEVRSGPVVLIGGFNNDWSMRLMGPQRFSFERDDEAFWIKDRQRPADKSHLVNYTTPYLSLTEDFALISRVLDPTTERMVVLAGGLTGYGTIAAGEFLSNPAYMEAVAGQLPKNWERKNVQILIGTKVIGGKSGPPRVLITHFW